MNIEAKELVVARNKLIVQSLRQKTSPVLPFELDLLETQFKLLVEEQEENSRLLSDANNQSSETWHDNHPAQAINERSGRVAIRAQKLQGIMENAIRFNYPDPGSKMITLGSIIEYRNEDSDNIVLLTGATSGPNSVAGTEYHMVSLQSPLGNAILGNEEGCEIAYKVGHKVLTMEVVLVSQLVVD